jgi:hypothetical protein
VRVGSEGVVLLQIWTRRNLVSGVCRKDQRLKQKAVIFGACILLFVAQGSAQVRVDAHLDRTRYLQGEPIFVMVDIQNVGDEAVAYQWGGHVALTVAGTQRRVPPNVFGCLEVFADAGGGAFDHPPLLPPGQSRSLWYLLKDYELKPGQYSLTASGNPGVGWKYYPWRSPPPKHESTDPVSGAEFERTLTLIVVPATDLQLKRAFA